MRAYRIVEVKDGCPHTLYHGVNGSRRLKVGEWLRASVRMVKDGSQGKPYLSGFQVFKYREFAEAFMAKRFRRPRELRVIEVQINHRNVRVKPSNPDVLLADQIRIPCGWDEEVA